MHDIFTIREFIISYFKKYFYQSKLILKSAPCTAASTRPKYFFTIYKTIISNTPTPVRMSLNISIPCRILSSLYYLSINKKI